MTIPSRVLANAARIPRRAAFMHFDGVEWSPTSWADYGDSVVRVGAALLSLGVGRGDAVAILGANRREWVVFDVGAMAVGATAAGIYATNSPEEVGYILGHSGSRVVLVENASQWAKVAAVRDGLEALHTIVLMDDAEEIRDPQTLRWDEFLRLGSDEEIAAAATTAIDLEPSDPATLIYTSGTTGNPKGVTLTHDNLAWTARQAVDLFHIDVDDRALSYLPLSHIAEQVFTILAPATAGYTVWFGRSIERLRSDLPAARPTLFFGVPRVWDGMARAVRAEVAKQKGPQRRLAEWALDSTRTFHLQSQGSGPSLASRAAYELAKPLTGRIKRRIGFGDTRLAVSGAAPVSSEVLEYLTGLDLVVREVYGQSEDTGPTTMNTFEATRLGTVGVPWPGTEVKIGTDGEILVKGRHVFAGYLGDEAATAATLVDGWLHSGDLGSFDEDGFLTITGRKKEIIVTSGGKNISPKAVEGILESEEAIENAVVIGDGRDYLTALIVPASSAGDDPRRAVAAAVATANERLARVERVKRFELLPGPLSIGAGELTPTLKIKRDVVAERYASLIELMYPSE